MTRLRAERPRLTMALKEAAAQLGVQPATLRQQIANRRLKATKRGRDWYVSTSETERYRQVSLGQPGRRHKVTKA